jgi:hypothetical protein
MNFMVHHAAATVLRLLSVLILLLPVLLPSAGCGGGLHGEDADESEAGEIPDAAEDDAAQDPFDVLGDDDPGIPDADTTDEDGVDEPDAPLNPWDRDILRISLAVDMEDFHATALIRLAPMEESWVFFEAQGLSVNEVLNGSGDPLEYRYEDGRLEVLAPAGGEHVEIEVDYGFSTAERFEGYMNSGTTLTWPYHCGNLFPCHSRPFEGQEFELQVTNVPDGDVAVYPEAIVSDAPAYQLAWAQGEYTYKTLGTTDAGTEVGFWFLPGSEARGDEGTAHLTAAVDWYEKTLGPYIFGNRIGAVEVLWGPGAIGGMEHHPYFHVSTGGLRDEAIHFHEAAHGWFGDGVRLRCWEDFVLSEGTVTYLAARALGQVVGEAAGTDAWNDIERELDFYVDREDMIVWPDSCGEVDILESGLFSRLVYMKGAFFYRDVADEVGAEVLDDVLARFYELHAGEAAGMQDMLDLILAETGFDPTGLADGWLRQLGRPDL